MRKTQQIGEHMSNLNKQRQREPHRR